MVPHVRFPEAVVLDGTVVGNVAGCVMVPFTGTKSIEENIHENWLERMTGLTTGAVTYMATPALHRQWRAKQELL